MGIPGLLRRIQDRSSPSKGEELNGYAAIVDGPALAYHAHSITFGLRPARMPSYADVNEAAIRWLKSLEQMKIKISAIIFDGAIPHSKEEERLSRLQDHIRGMITARTENPRGHCPILRRQALRLYPLLASALLEALRETTYASVTHVVPGEADDYCASYAKATPRSIVFTKDTDLLLYNYPKDVAVSFHVNALPHPRDNRLYWPTKMAAEMGVPSMLHFAFAVICRPSVSTSQLIEHATRFDASSSEFLSFKVRYEGNFELAETTLNCLPLNTAVQALDARVSELVFQILPSDGLNLEHLSSTPKVYLPILFEDHLQASAWYYGRHIRVLAYSLLSHRYKVPMTISEYTRKAQNMSITKLSTEPEPLQQIEDLIVQLKRWKAPEHIPSEHAWPLLAVAVAFAPLSFPRIRNLASLIYARYDESWTFIQLTAKLQAALYSLRMLKQCACLWLAVQKSPSTSSRSYLAVSELDHLLESLPPIASHFVIPGETRREGDMTPLLDAVRDLYKTFGVVEEGEPDTRTAHKMNRRARRQANPRSGSAWQEGSDNVFNALNEA